MPDQSWICRVCGEENPAYTEACRDCYVPYGQGKSARRCQCGELIEGKGPDCPQCERKNILLRNASEPQPETLGRWSDDGTYIPNKYSKRSLISLGLASVLLMLQAVFGFLSGEIVIVGQNAKHAQFHGTAVLFVCVGVFFLALSRLVLVADHFDKRRNEDFYRRVSLYSTDIAWISLALGLFFDSPAAG